MSQESAVTTGQSVVERFKGDLDRATNEVFSTMLGVGCEPVSAEAGTGGESLSAVIGLAGALSGSLVLYTTSEAAMCMAEKMMGIAPAEVDEMVRDAIGEVCNMIAGAWKGFDPLLASGCLLSTPTIVSGSSYELFSQEAPIRIRKGYRFEKLTFTVTITCEPEG